MSGVPSLQAFVDDEIERFAVRIEKTIDDALVFMGKPPEPISAKDRALALDVAVMLRPLRRKACEAFIESLRQQARAPGAARLASSSAAPLPARKGLSLVAEAAVSGDVVVAQCVTELKAAAEAEMRDLAALAATLAGDAQVVAERTPFSAEPLARALWASAQVLHSGGGLREGFMKFVSRPFAQELRSGLADAIARLEGIGVEPAGFGSVVVSGTPRGAAASTPAAPARVAPSRPMAVPAAAPPAAPSPVAADSQYIDLIGRIFDHFLADRDLPADVRLAISHLVSPAIRLATTDGSLLDGHEHPIWRFIDRIAWQVQILPAAAHNDRRAAFRFIETLIAQITSQGVSDPKVYAFALGSLEAAERQRLEDKRRQHAPQLARLEDEEFPDTLPAELHTGQGGREISRMETAPAPLLDAVSAVDVKRRDTAWVGRLQPGDAARIVLSQEWQHVQLLWRSPEQRSSYWADCRSEKGWPLSGAALEALAREGLALPLLPKSLLKSAARAVASKMTA